MLKSQWKVVYVYFVYIFHMFQTNFCKTYVKLTYYKVIFDLF